MKKTELRYLKDSLAIILIFFFQACSYEPVNLGAAKEEVINYYESGKFDRELNNVVDKAIEQFRNISLQDSDAVIFDIDETALSNYKINKELDFGYIQSMWDDWVQEAKAPAMSGVKRLYDYILQKGFRIVFITGRKDFQYNSTYKNLLSAGYTKFDTLIVRRSEENKLTALDYKSRKRVELTERGYKVVGDVGDQNSDLEGPDHGIQIKIPNYMYIIK